MSALSYKKLIEKKPWLVSWRNARRRCIDELHKTYKYYGGNGIKFELSKEECAYLWQRDHAWLLENPELDRIDEKGNYCLENCQFLSKLDNLAKRKKPVNEKETTEEWTD